MSLILITKSVWSNPGNKGRRFCKLFDALKWQLYKRVIKRPKMIKLPNQTRFWAHPDCVISSALQYADWPEYHELQFCRRHLTKIQGVIDVGANVGHVSLLLADLVKPENIYCFEPTPVTFKRLQENWRLNGWSSEHLHQLALGATATKMFIPNTASPVSTNAVQPSQRNPDDVAIEVRPLDAMIPLWRGLEIGLLKIDVEGSEKEVFAGGKTLLSELRPRLIMFESLDKQIEPSVAECLAAARYRIFQLDRDGRPYFGGTTAQNLFAVPEEGIEQAKSTGPSE